MSSHAKWLFLLTTPLAAQTTWIVETGNPAAMPSLAAAVAAANDGDVIRVRNGIEDVGGLQVTKSLRILGEGSFFGGSTLLISGPTGAPLTITVPAGKEVSLVNCQLGWTQQFQLAVAVVNCDGRVTFQDVAWGYAPIHVTTCRQVVFAATTLNPSQPIHIQSSTVAFDRCCIIGHRAETEFATLPSEPALFVLQSTVHCVETTLRGGDGHLLGQLAGSRALTLFSSTMTVAGSTSVIASGTLTTESAVLASHSLLVLDPPLAPTIVMANTTVLQRPLPSVMPANFVSGQTASLALHTPTGSLSALIFGMPGDRSTLAGVSGDLWIDPQVCCTPVFGVQNGSLAWTIVIPPSPALFATPIRWQGAMLHQGQAVLGAPGAALLR